jgi:hypothetical protein
MARTLRRALIPVPALAAAFLLVAPPRAQAQTFETQLSASDKAFGDQLGGAVAVDGNTLVAGARQKSSSTGAAYVFRRAANGTWSQEAKLTGTGTVAQDQFGRSVGLDGSLAVIGAPDPFDLFGSASGPGRAFIFRRSGTTWTQEVILTATDGLSTDQLGYSASLALDRALVGAQGDQSSGSGSRYGGRGAAYVFRNTTGSTWTQEVKLVGSDALAGDLAGTAVSLDPTDNDLAAVGAPGKDGTGVDSGAVYLFRRTGTSWAQEAKLTASDAAAGDQFGCAVAVSGDLVAIGAYLQDSGAADAGAVYIFRKSGAVWTQEAKLQASDLAASDYYGVSVALVGNHLAVGSYNDNAGAGSVYVHDKPGASWVQTSKLTQPSTGLLGSAVGLTADLIGSGAAVTDVGPTSLAGAAYAWSTIPSPSVAGVAPSSGLFNTTTPVTVTGSNFSEAGLQSVTFGGVPATNVAWVSPTQITCTAPTGTQNQVVGVTVTQNGLSNTLVNSFTYVGADITSISPGSGPSTGGPNVTLNGTNFINDGSTVVTFGGNPAAVVSVTPTAVVVDPPAGTRGSSVNVVITCTNGTDTVVNGWTYELLSILSVDKAAKNLLGGSTITLTMNWPTTLPDTTVTLGGSPVTVTAVTASTVSFTAPGVAEPTGTGLDITVTNSNGSDTETAAFFYSPALIIGVTGNTTTGGTVSFDWKADVDAAGQLVYLWVGDPLAPPISATLGGYAGVLHHVPYLFIFTGFPENPHPIVLNYGPLTPAIAGFPLKFQALVTGEGGAKGSFSNVRTVIIP